MTIRKVMKECLSKGVFGTALDISKHPLVSMVPWEIAKKYKPKAGQERQTVRYYPAKKAHETPELLQLAGELHNHKTLDELQRHFRAGDMKAFYATAEKVLQIQCGNPVVKSVIKEEQLITDRDSVEQAIAEYFEDVYGGKDREADSEEDLTLWTRLEATADLMVQLFTTADVTEAMKASNFNKGLCPDGFDGCMLRPGDASHRSTHEITAQITSLLNNPMTIS